jgi:hypothetical protein
VKACTDRGGRGCPCEFHQASRDRWRRWAARKRQQLLDARNRTSRTCQRRSGPGACGGVLETVTDMNGRTSTICPLCERRRAGICRDCPAPVEGHRGKALRCARHKETARLEQTRRYAQSHREEIARRANARYHQDEAARLRKLEYKRLWRKANPDKVRAAKQRYAKRYGSQQDSRYLDYHRRYNAQTARQQAKRAAARAAYYRAHPARPDPRCRVCAEPLSWWKPGHGRPPLLCDRHCNKYDLPRRLAARANPAVRTTPEPSVLPKLRIRRPMPVRYDEAGHRLCLTPGCDIVVTRRKKKCSKCRARELQAARAVIDAKHRGRGRRTDLEHVA